MDALRSMSATMNLLNPSGADGLHEPLHACPDMQRHLAEGIYALSLARTRGEVHQVLMGRSATILPGPHWFLGRPEAKKNPRMVRLEGWHASLRQRLGPSIEGLGIPLQDTGFAREVFDNRHLCFIPDIASAPEMLQGGFAKAYGLKSLLGIPLVFEGRITGVLFAASFVDEEPFAPSEAHLAMLQSLARIAALALERIEAEASMESSANLARDLATAVRDLASAASEAVLMESLFRWAARLAPMPEWWFNRFDEGTRSSITTHWTPGIERLGSEEAIRRPISVEGNPLLEKLHYTQESVLIEQCDDHPDLSDRGLWPYRSLVMLPLAHEERIVGFLSGGSFGDQGAVTLSQDRYESLRSLAEAAGLVLGRLQAREALESQERRFRMLFTQSPDPILLLQDGCILDVNAAAPILFGLDRREMLGRTVLSFSPELQPEGTPSPQACEKHMAGALDGNHERFEWTFLSGGRGEVICLVDLTRLEAGERPLLHAIVRDISARKRAEAERVAMERQLFQAQKMESLGVLAGGIAHDFNNLLMGVLGHAGLALDQLNPLHPIRRNLESIQKAGQRAADLTRQMLAYSGRGQFLVQSLDLTDQVEEMLHLLEVSLPKSVLLSLDLRRRLPPISADASQVQQIIMNLVINAAEAIGEVSGYITLTTGTEVLAAETLASMRFGGEAGPGSYVYLEVSDTGCGMAEETLDRIFEPFFTTKFTGRGLGLSALMGIVRGHKGALSVRSEPARGTSFKVYFPAQTDEGVLSGTKGDELTKISSGLILVVDDDETVRAVARQALEMRGFEVLEARDGRFGVDQVKAHGARISVVLLDMTMPHMSGSAAFKEMRQLQPELPVVLSSGYSEAEALGRFEGEGLKGFIQKPYSPRDLIAQIQTVLGN
jgi:PAS domain S-box-containing protein